MNTPAKPSGSLEHRKMMTARPLISAGIALGVGMGGFFDGILFHQLLQVHNMLSAEYPTRGLAAEQLVIHLQINMFWDGVFHAFTWLMTLAGIGLLWSAAKDRNVKLTGPTLVGSMVFGWGLFNLVEGIINHHLLHIHHVTESSDHLQWDLAFLASGVVFIVVGYLLIRRSTSHAGRSRRSGVTEGAAYLASFSRNKTQ